MHDEYKPKSSSIKCRLFDPLAVAANNSRQLAILLHHQLQVQLLC